VTGTKVTAPARDGDLAAIELLEHAADRHGAAGLVAMHGAQHDEARAGLEAGEGDGLELMGLLRGARIHGPLE
jgi:hypothetical protein